MTRRLVWVLSLLAAVAAAAGCAPTDGGAPAAAAAPARVVEVRVSAATTLKRAFEEMETSYEAAHPDVDLIFNFGPSGVLQKQVEGGAPCDVFASAAPAQIDALVEGGYVSVEETGTLCGNELAIIVPTGARATVSGPDDLAGLSRITTGDPATTPYGAKAEEWLVNLGAWEALSPRMVLAANVAQSLDYVARREVDAGIVFASEAWNQPSVEIAYAVPAAQLTSPIRYVIAPVAPAGEATAARDFIEYTLSAEGQAELDAWGFIPVADIR
ncbi:MAG: molybdate ABC transporter substrate-binding protein [Coriobacteriia bacterium]